MLIICNCKIVIVSSFGYNVLCLAFPLQASAREEKKAKNNREEYVSDENDSQGIRK